MLAFIKVELSINENNEIIVSNKKEIIKTNAYGDIQSCFITEQKNIICFICIIYHLMIIILFFYLIKI